MMMYLRFVRYLSLGACLLVLCACDDYGKRLRFKKGELYYTEGISEAEAQQLGDFLVRYNFFDDHTTKSIQLAKRGKDYVCRMVVKDNYQDDHSLSELTEAIKALEQAISDEVFRGERVIFALCDSQFKTLREIKP